MEEQDALVHPVSCKEGWDAPVETILEAHPEVVAADSFPCPVDVPRLGGVTEKLVEMISEEERPISSSVPQTFNAIEHEGNKGHKK